MKNKLLFISELITRCLVKCNTTHHETKRKKLLSNGMYRIPKIVWFFFSETDKPKTTYRCQDNKKKEHYYAVCAGLCSFSTSLIVLPYERNVHCHEYCTSNVASRQVYLSFVTKGMFIAMSIVPVMLLLDNFTCLSLRKECSLPWVLYQ